MKHLYYTNKQLNAWYQLPSVCNMHNCNMESSLFLFTVHIRLFKRYIFFFTFISKQQDSVAALELFDESPLLNVG